MNGRNTALVLLVILIIGAAAVWEYRDSAWLSPILGTHNAPTAQTQVGAANYSCDAGKTISATYFAGASAAAPANPATPPVPNGSVALVLSDGRSMTLPQAISGSGIRYASADGQTVFWSEGNTAFITEGQNQAQTFANCIGTSNISGQESWKTFASSTMGFSIRYPSGYTLNTSYVNQTLGPGKNIKGIQVTVPATEATGTNLASDSGVSVEQIANTASCSAGLFIGDQVGSTTEVVDNGVTYSVAKGGDAGAGNLYNETVYALPGTSPCIAVRYFIHSTELGNYPPGMVKAFDQVGLLNEFDGIRRSLVVGK